MVECDAARKVAKNLERSVEPMQYYAMSDDDFDDDMDDDMDDDDWDDSDDDSDEDDDFDEDL